MLQQIWQKALVDSIKNREKNFVGNENNRQSARLGRLKLKKAFLRLKIFYNEGFLPENCNSLVHLPKNVKRKPR